MTGSGPWLLDKFVDALGRWQHLEKPDPALVRTVELWMAARADVATEGCHRDPGMPDHWFAEVRGTARGAGPTGTVVVCSFLVFHTERRLQCTTLATLTRPVTG